MTFSRYCKLKLFFFPLLQVKVVVKISCYFVRIVTKIKFELLIYYSEPILILTTTLTQLKLEVKNMQKVFEI